MIRVRARSVFFNTPVERSRRRFSNAMRRVFAGVPGCCDELVAQRGSHLPSFFLVLPAVFLGFRLAFATERWCSTTPT